MLTQFQQHTALPSLGCLPLQLCALTPLSERSHLLYPTFAEVTDSPTPTCSLHESLSTAYLRAGLLSAQKQQSCEDKSRTKAWRLAPVLVLINQAPSSMPLRRGLIHQLTSAIRHCTESCFHIHAPQTCGSTPRAHSSEHLCTGLGLTCGEVWTWYAYTHALCHLLCSLTLPVQQKFSARERISACKH
jgi:hypothetical protein